MAYIAPPESECLSEALCYSRSISEKLPTGRQQFEKWSLYDTHHFKRLGQERGFMDLGGGNPPFRLIREGLYSPPKSEWLLEAFVYSRSISGKLPNGLPQFEKWSLYEPHRFKRLGPESGFMDLGGGNFPSHLIGKGLYSPPKSEWLLEALSYPRSISGKLPTGRQQFEKWSMYEAHRSNRLGPES